MILDLHCHSKYSKDAITSPRRIAEIAKQKGLVVALTDHNNARGWSDYKKACKSLGVDFVLGQEQKVFWQGKFAGELLFLFLNGEIKSHDVLESIDEARAQQAFVSVAHPFESVRRTHFGKFLNLDEIVSKIDAIEVYNSRCLVELPNKKAKQFAEQNSLGITAGSDAHFAKEIGNAFVELQASSLEQARSMLKKGKATVHGKLANPIVHFETQLAKFGLIKKETD